MNDFRKELTLYLANETDTLQCGMQIAKATADGTIIALHGPLGAGKTTFARGFLQGLGHQGKVKSPTYTLIEPYEVAGHTVYHFDLYRLQTAEELLQIGLQDYFSPHSICLIEWAEKGHPILPPADLDCYLSLEGEGRKLHLMSYSSLGTQILDRME